METFVQDVFKITIYGLYGYNNGSEENPATSVPQMPPHCLHSDSSSLTFENDIKRAHPINLPTSAHFSEDRMGTGTKPQVGNSTRQERRFIKGLGGRGNFSLKSTQHLVHISIVLLIVLNSNDSFDMHLFSLSVYVEARTIA